MNTLMFYKTVFNENDRLSVGDNRHLVELYRKRFLYKTLIEKYQPKSILQIACGTGIHTHWLCENYPEIQITASDLVPEHVDQVHDYPNLTKLVWDCCDAIPESFGTFDMVLVEGAWYHIKDRDPLLTNLRKLNPDTIVIDWLSAWHDTTQRMLQEKKMPEDYKNPRPNAPFVFDTEDDLNLLNGYDVKLFPVDMDIRFGYIDFNKVEKEEFEKFIDAMNRTIQLYDSNQTYILNATEHGCYVLRNK